MDTRFISVFVVISTITIITLPGAYSTPMNTTDNETTPLPSTVPSGGEMEVLANAVRRHPELKDWYFRLKERFMNHTDPKDEDVNEVRALLKEAQNSIYEFVTGPHFNDTATMYIESAIAFARPLIAAFPLRELREFVKIVDNDPDLSKLAHGGKDDLLRFMSNLDADTVKNLVSQGIAPGMAEMLMGMIPHEP
ncbi:unnamed protein product [Orchesella dallaii]|uniref:Uncharacterized protein n=1 Tax=Orchesella dallaii TaxID=48710 RepID=A0ABP1Q6L3_9HEXA